MIFDPAEEHWRDMEILKLLSIMTEKDFFPDEKEIEGAEMVAIFIIPTEYTDQIPRVSPSGPHNYLPVDFLFDTFQATRKTVKHGVLRKQRPTKKEPRVSDLEDLPKWI